MAKKPMTKKDIVAAIAADAGINLSQADAALGALVEMCRDEVKKGAAFRVTGLGTFSLKKTKARKGVNPATGESIKISAKKRMSFKASSLVADMLNPAKK